MIDQGEQWAAVEIMGHRQHVGRIREVRFAGVDMLEIEALERDGTTKVLRYGGSAIFSMTHITEDEARRALVPKSWDPCDTFTASAVLPGACADCGFTREEHEAKAERMAQKALPAHEADAGEDEVVDDDDDDDGDDEAEERMDEARAEEEDDLREVILNIVRAHRKGSIPGAYVEELVEVAAVYFGDDAFERAFDGVEGQSE